VFNAVQAGEHEVHVRRAGNEIAGSPFIVLVSDAEIACVEGVKVYGRGLTDGQTGQPCQFYINTADAGQLSPSLCMPAMGHWGTCSPLISNCLIFQVISEPHKCLSLLHWTLCGCLPRKNILAYSLGWRGGVMVSALDSRPRGRGFNSRPVHHQAATLGKLLTPMCLCHQAVQFGTGQRAVMLCCREGNHRSGIALAMRHRL